LDARNVGVTNNLVQDVCKGYVAGGFYYFHASINLHPLSFALAKDALINGGPGQISRLDLPTVCSTYASPGLDVLEIGLTYESLFIAGISLFAYNPKVSVEPPIMSYAT
jgi:hypothetical protein